MVYYVEEWVNKFDSIKVFDERLLSRNRATWATVVGYVKGVKQFISFLGFKDPDSALEYLKKQANKASVIDDAVGKASKKKGPSHVGQIMKGVKKWLQLNDVEVNWKKVIMPGVETSVEDRMPKKEELKYIMDCSGLRDTTIIEVAASSGLRAGALATLTLGDVNFDFDDPDVARILVKRQPGRKVSKKQKFFVTFITPEAKKLLLQYIEERKARGERITEESPLFAVEKGGYLGKPLPSAAYFSLWWNRLLRRARLTEKSGNWFKIHFHTLRRFFETQCINAGVKQSYREFWMGHTGPYLDASYFRGEEKSHLEEYRKAIPFLSITEERQGVVKEVRTLKEQLQQLRQENLALKQRLNEDLPSSDQVQELLRRIEKLEKQAKQN